MDHIAALFVVSAAMLGIAVGFVLGIAYKVRMDRAAEADRRYAGYRPPRERRLR